MVSANSLCLLLRTRESWKSASEYTSRCTEAHNSVGRAAALGWSYVKSQIGLIINQSKSFCSSEEYKVLASNCKATDATLSFHGQKEFSLNQNLWTAMWGAVVPWIEDGGGVGQKAFDEHRKHGRQGVHRTFVYSFRSFWLLLLPKISRPFYVA